MFAHIFYWNRIPCVNVNEIVAEHIVMKKQIDKWTQKPKNNRNKFVINLALFCENHKDPATI